MANAALSNRERRELKKKIKPAPRHAPADPALRVVKARAEPVVAEPPERDGLVWLSNKKQITPPQTLAGLDYRALFRHVIDFGGADVQSCLNTLLSVSGGKGSGMPTGGSYSASAARAELFRLRWIVLGGQTDLLTVMDGVCGVGHTLGFLAGKQRMREEQLKAALRIALDLMVADKIARAAKKSG